MTGINPHPLRPILRNAATWAAAWAAAGGSIVAAITLLDPGPGAGSLPGRLGMAVLMGAAWGVRFAVAGGVVGAVFASVVRLNYRGRRLAEISPTRFGLLGALVGGVGVPLYLQAMNVLFGGGPIAWGLVLDDAPWAAVFGATVAAGSILLARRTDSLPCGGTADPLAGGADPRGLAGARQEQASPARPSHEIHG